MKKITAFIMALTLLGLTACGNSDSSSDVLATTTQNVTTTLASETTTSATTTAQTSTAQEEIPAEPEDETFISGIYSLPFDNAVDWFLENICDGNVIKNDDEQTAIIYDLNDKNGFEAFGVTWKSAKIHTSTQVLGIEIHTNYVDFYLNDYDPDVNDFVKIQSEEEILSAFETAKLNLIEKYGDKYGYGDEGYYEGKDDLDGSFSVYVENDENGIWGLNLSFLDPKIQE